MACNERCPFCNVPVEDYKTPTLPMEILQEQLQAFVASGEQTLVISGGEPTLLRRRLLQLIRDAQDGGIPFVELQTNATLIDDEYASALREAGLTSAFVSLLSHIPAHHDFMTGLDGAFETCIKGIRALLDQDIRVTLNPVIAQRTQALVGAYIDFIAEQFPRIRSISLSAVQPHGRAAEDPSLLPDYGILATHVRAARQRASMHNIELLNPYCGLPLCIGWENDLDASVEAIEAVAALHIPPGVDNRGNKSQRGPCQQCALRTRCGGAWHAYWTHHDGAGIKAPLHSVVPWLASGVDSPGQTIVSSNQCFNDSHWDAARTATTPTVWMWAERLEQGDARRLLESGCTDLAVDFDLSQAQGHIETIRELRRVQRVTALAPPQRQIRIHLGWSPMPEPTTATEADTAFALAAGLGAATLFIPHPMSRSIPAWQTQLSAAYPQLQVVTLG